MDHMLKFMHAAWSASLGVLPLDIPAAARHVYIRGAIQTCGCILPFTSETVDRSPITDVHPVHRDDLPPKMAYKQYAIPCLDD